MGFAEKGHKWKVTGEWLDASSDYDFLAGRQAGLLDAVCTLRRMSGEAFSAREDSLAEALRNAEDVLQLSLEDVETKLNAARDINRNLRPRPEVLPP